MTKVRVKVVMLLLLRHHRHNNKGIINPPMIWGMMDWDPFSLGIITSTVTCINNHSMEGTT